MPSVPKNSQRSVAVESVDADDNTVELSFSSESPVVRSFGDEVLSHEPGAMREERITASAPLLVNHDRNDQIGVIERVEVSAGQGRAVVRFSRSPRAQEFLQDVRDGIRRNVSVSYDIHATRVEPRAGQRDLVTVTDWSPQEISIVSVPADFSVGVGRSQETAMPKIDTIERATARKRGRKAAKTKQSGRTVRAPDIRSHEGLLERAMGGGHAEIDQLAELLERGRYAVAQGGRARPDGDFVADRRLSTAAAVSGSLDVSGSLRPLFGTAGSTTSSSTMQAGAETTLSAALLNTSRVMRAGAQLVPIPQDVGFDTGAGIPAFTQTASGYEIVEPAAFETGEPDANDEVTLTPGELNLKRATAVRDAMSMYGVQLKIPRSAMKQRGARQVAAELYTSIALGIARVADIELLGALGPQVVKNFTLSDVAAIGSHFDDLQALIGTDGTGAVTTEAGQLMAMAGGIRTPAALTPDMAPTIVGEWPRAALALGGEVRMMLQRTNAAGSLVATAWIDVQPLLPDLDRFWTIGATA